MAGLAIAAVTGGARWVGAAVIGSLGFAIGGALSYGRFIEPAFRGSLEAIVSLALIGFVWGGLGCLGLGLGLALPKYHLKERAAIAGGLFLVWLAVDRLIWARLTGAEDLRTRELMVLALLMTWATLAAYVGIGRNDRTSVVLGVAGGGGFAVGFPLAAWVQGIGPLSGLPLDWWKVAEHVIGLCGGLALGWAVLTLEEPTWAHPLSVRPWERWLAIVWLLWVLPTWLIANALDYWIAERAAWPIWTGRWVWSVLLLILIILAIWGWMEIRRGRLFVTSWMPRHLKVIFLSFLWIVTTVACAKTLLAGLIQLTPFVFWGLAALITWLVFRLKR
jgi:hypothetical protein